MRQAKFEEFRRTMSTRADLYFRMISMQRNYTGSLMFDHGSETLEICVRNICNLRSSSTFIIFIRK